MHGADAGRRFLGLNRLRSFSNRGLLERKTIELNPNATSPVGFTQVKQLGKLSLETHLPTPTN